MSEQALREPLWRWVDVEGTTVLRAGRAGDRVVEFRGVLSSKEEVGVAGFGVEVAIVL